MMIKVVNWLTVYKAPFWETNDLLYFVKSAEKRYFECYDLTHKVAETTMLFFYRKQVIFVSGVDEREAIAWVQQRFFQSIQ